MKLSSRIHCTFQSAPFLARVERGDDNAWYLRSLHSQSPQYIGMRWAEDVGGAGDFEGVELPADFRYLREGDILRINPQGETRVLYRKNSRHNVLFFTERCNSRCLMCSQPPREVDDRHLVDEILHMIPAMSQDTTELGITGGEPTLQQDKLIKVIGAVRDYLPATSLHMLSNGRLFSYLRLAENVAAIRHPDFMIGIPLYADTADVHDFVVQAKGAFEQTLRGILNLARAGIRIELRMVIHRQTYERLPQFARFVSRNLPFVDQVVLMGLEMTGYTRSNLEALWVDPVDYQDPLEACVQALEEAAIPVHIFNHPLCLLRPALHRFARRSISDWKNIYLPECGPCTRKTECGGFFTSAKLRYSVHVRPF